MILDDVKKALRMQSDRYDEDLLILIKAALYDLRRLDIQIKSDEEQDPEVKTAVILYVKSKFGTSDATNKEFFWSAYENIRMSLLLDCRKKGDR